MERSGSSLRARRAARRRRKPTCCRSNSFQNGGFVFSLAPRTEGTREQAFGRSRGGVRCKIYFFSDAPGPAFSSPPAGRAGGLAFEKGTARPRGGPRLFPPAFAAPTCS